MLEAIRTAWRKWRINRRQYQIDRAMYKAGGSKDPRHGGFDAGKNRDAEVKNMSNPPGSSV